MNKERIVLGYEGSTLTTATLWEGMLLLKRNRLPHPLIRKWRGRYIVAGRFWKEVPHAFVKNPLNLILYEDTLMSTLTYIIRPIIRKFCCG